jgi:2-polyprenyl-3-methyl-5-hydroxy-6-metoxy-1,4-benzoquinol methylase
MSTESIDVSRLRQKMAEVVEQHGEWTAHSIQIVEGLSTLESPGDDHRLIRIVQLIADLVPKPMAECRVLDLACGEGQYAIECALHGAEVVAIEGREANIAKVQFVKDALSLDRLSLHQDDVRTLSREQYGSFDIVICSGILYHLDTPDVFEFAKRIGEVCRGLAIVDTQISLNDRIRFEYDGREYWGDYYREHAPEASPTERLKDLWASIENIKSVWLTRPSLYNLLRHVGFTTVLECHVPSMGNLAVDRVSLAAIKGERARILSSPRANSCPPEASPERITACVHGFQDPKVRAIQTFKSYLPGFIRTPLREIRAWLRKKRRATPAGPWEWTEPWRRR